MAYNYRKLRGKIKEICGTEGAFASELGINRASLSSKLNNKIEFSQEEMMRSVVILDLKIKDIPSYFFEEKVEKTQQKMVC